MIIGEKLLVYIYAFIIAAFNYAIGFLSIILISRYTTEYFIPIKYVFYIATLLNLF